MCIRSLMTSFHCGWRSFSHCSVVSSSSTYAHLPQPILSNCRRFSFSRRRTHALSSHATFFSGSFRKMPEFALNDRVFIGFIGSRRYHKSTATLQSASGSPACLVQHQESVNESARNGLQSALAVTQGRNCSCKSDARPPACSCTGCKVK